MARFWHLFRQLKSVYWLSTRDSTLARLANNLGWRQAKCRYSGGKIIGLIQLFGRLLLTNMLLVVSRGSRWQRTTISLLFLLMV